MVYSLYESVCGTLNLTCALYIIYVSHSPSLSTDRADGFRVYESWSGGITAVCDRSLHHAQATNSPAEQHISWQFLPGHVRAGTEVTGTHQKMMHITYHIHCKNWGVKITPVSVDRGPHPQVLKLHPRQLGTFFANGEWACSPFVTKSGHADNPATFEPCVKSMTADFISQIHNVPHGGLPYNFVRQICVT